MFFFFISKIPFFRDLSKKILKFLNFKILLQCSPYYKAMGLRSIYFWNKCNFCVMYWTLTKNVLTRSKNAQFINDWTMLSKVLWNFLHIFTRHTDWITKLKAQHCSYHLTFCKTNKWTITQFWKFALIRAAPWHKKYWILNFTISTHEYTFKLSNNTK